MNGKISKAKDLGKELLAATDDATRSRLSTAIATNDSEASQLLDVLMRGTSEQGRTLNANKIMAGLTDDPVLWLVRASRHAGRPLADAERAEILSLLEAGKRQEMLRYVGTLKSHTTSEKLVTAWKSGLLTWWETHGATSPATRPLRRGRS